MPVSLVAERDVDQDYLVAAAESSMRLSEAMGFEGDPEIALHYLENGALRLNRRGQVDRTVIDTLSADGRLTMVMTARDLGPGDAEGSALNYVFGTSRLGRLIMSTARLESLDDFAALTLHEAGHAEGLVQPTERNYDRLSGFAGHCVNQCLMLPGNSYTDLQTMVWQNRLRDPFCGDCSDFLSHRPRY